MAFQSNKYRVFLSFRGVDVRKSLVDHLYQSLVVAGISTFLDSEELKKSHDIKSSLEKAIVESEIYIPIFSPKYAESSWCLQELSQMCSQAPLHKMIPLFYKVEPSHVRHPDDERSPYANAFHKHSTKGRHTKDTIDQWKNALKAASDLSGFSLEEASGYEAKLVKQVVMDVLNILNNKSLHVAKRPVGLANRMNNLKDMLKIDPNDKSVRTVGVWGMGGIGKTTLCKAIFNDIKSKFDASCFVSNVREEESKKGLTKLQKQILKGLLKTELDVDSVDEGLEKMKEYLGSIHALLLLDDVDDEKQLEALHGDRCFGGGSRVIITTRDKHILNLAHVDEIYEVEQLEHNQALELFSWHAFLRECPDEGYEDLSARVVKACKGLPLSLEVMGAHLYDKKDDKAIWDEAVIGIKSLMDKPVYETLKISYNGLHEEEKQIFLDIACFFVGENKELTIRYWEALGCKKPRTAVKNLSLKSLIRLEDLSLIMRDCFTMHDHLRDLGREIVAEESREDPCNRSRLWHSDDVRRVLREGQEISNLRGFKCCGFENVVAMESLALMKNMKFLWLKDVELVGQQFPPKLKCLVLGNCRYVLELLTLPEGLVLANICDLSTRRISFNMSQMNEMKVLHVSGCSRLAELPGLDSLQALKELELGYCDELAELPPLPRGLDQALIEHCSRLKTISFDISQMNQMTVLKMSHCKSLTKLPGFGSLQSLTKLELNSCTELAELPPLPRGLVQVNIEWCSRLKTISFDTSQMNELKVLKLFDCESLTDLGGLGSLQSLKELKLINCMELAELPGLGSLQSLKELELSYCTALSELPPLPRGIVQVSIKGGILRKSRLKTISFDMSQMNELKVLKLSACESLTNLPGLGSLQSLKELELSYCTELAELPPLPRGLVQVSIQVCSWLKTISFDTSQMNEMTVLKLSNCDRLTKLPGFGSLHSLTKLELIHCWGLEELPPLPRGLVQISVTMCYPLKTISFDTSQMNALRELELSHCTALAELPPLPRGLVQVCIQVCPWLETISFDTSQMNEMTVLKLSHCDRLTKLPGFGSLQSLTKLELIHCPGLPELPPLPRGLVQVSIEWCSRLKTISFDTAQMNALKELELRHCDELAELPPLPRGLVQVSIERCSRLKAISFDTSQMNELKVLKLSDCESLTELPGLGSLKSLTELKASYCENLSKLSELALLESLTDLDLQGSQNVKSLAGMELLKYLKRLIVSGTSMSQINVGQWIQGLSGLQVLCLSANGIPEWLQVRVQRMLIPENRDLGEYCVMEDAKCTGIVIIIRGGYFTNQLEVNISTEDEEISRDITLELSRDTGGHDHLGVVQEELPSIIKFRSGDVIRCSTRAEIVGVYLELGQNRGGNDDVDIQSNQSLSLQRPREKENANDRRPLFCYCSLLIGCSILLLLYIVQSIT